MMAFVTQPQPYGPLSPVHHHFLFNAETTTKVRFLTLHRTKHRIDVGGLLTLPSFFLRFEPNLIPTLVWQLLPDLLDAVHFELQAHNFALVEVQ